MIRLPIGTETRLPARALFRLEDGISQWIECENGAIWISQQNNPRDIVLTAGESAVVAAPGRRDRRRDQRRGRGLGRPHSGDRGCGMKPTPVQV